MTASKPKVGRYAIFEVIASGGMASVYLGRLYGAVGFSRVVAIKRLHPHLARDPEFADMFLTEARIAARIRHPNVVQTFDVVAEGSEVSLVMEYVQGESLAWLLRESARREQTVPLAIAASIIVNTLHGLHAAHEACDERGLRLEIVHRDVSPQNVLVGADGVARVFDFGVAKALQSVHETRAGLVKGKSSYMSPEQIRAGELDRRGDIFSAGVVLWEMLTARRIFGGATEAQRIYKVLQGNYEKPSAHNPGISAALEAVVMRAISYKAAERYATALEFADAVERVLGLASQRAVSEWVAEMAASSLSTRAELVKQVEISDVYPVAAPEPEARARANELRSAPDLVGSVVLPLPTPEQAQAGAIGTRRRVVRWTYLLAAVLAPIVGAVFVLQGCPAGSAPPPHAQLAPTESPAAARTAMAAPISAPRNTGALSAAEPEPNAPSARPSRSDSDFAAKPQSQLQRAAPATRNARPNAARRATPSNGERSAGARSFRPTEL